MKKISKILVKCPKCNNTLGIDIDYESLNFKGGIASLSILHGSPPHTMIVYVDENGSVRSVEVTDVLISLAPEVKVEERREVAFDELKRFIGRDFFVYFFSSIVADVPLYVVTSGDTGRLSNFFKTFFGEFPIEISFHENTILDNFGISIISKEFLDKNQEIAKKSVVYDMDTGSFNVSNIKLKYMRGLVKKWIDKGYKGLVEMVSEVNKLKMLFSKILDELNKSDKIVLNKFIKELKLTSKEADFFIDLLKIRGVDVDKKVIWNPFIKV